MTYFQILLVALVLFFNLLFAQPSWADRPPLDTNADYIELTQSLENLTEATNTGKYPEGLTQADVEQKITQLTYQKYILETAKEPVGICDNQSGKTLAVYGKKPKKSESTYDEIIYLLPDGEITDDEDFDCDGVYIPTDVQVANVGLEGTAVAIKIIDGSQLVISSNPETGVLELNLPPTQVYLADEVNWEIPDLTQADLETTFPDAPTD
ncbi:hypothetical protein [Gloeothece verrucosa]|uniref:Uncharacterized protein n=1 Tax=Gloeothece verrucosa (strain PCC 7822) TaxID=497965 RepID=E0U6C2_GLOV7|nr:hypothetical protein [Gloeothece verrucosa]ADN13565.1 conserved hypothetical protein [Gloeothece verrucosa PCC 7822]